MARKSRTLVSPGQGGCWKLLEARFLVQTMQLHHLDEETLFEAIAIPDGVVNLYHIKKVENGKTARDLISSLPHSFILGSTASFESDPDELDGPAMWAIGSEEEILAKVWTPIIIQHPPRDVAECESLAKISRRFCYLAIIFEETEVIADVRIYGTMISVDDLRRLVEKRGKWDTRVAIADNGDGTFQIVLDPIGKTLRQLLPDMNGDIEMGRFVLA